MEFLLQNNPGSAIELVLVDYHFWKHNMLSEMGVLGLQVAEDAAKSPLPNLF